MDITYRTNAKMDLIMNIRLILLAVLLPVFIQGCTSSQELPCVFTPIQTKENPYPELTQFKNCGHINSKGNINLKQEIFKKIWFNEDGLAEIRVYDGIYYINKNKRLVRTHLFDNTADYFKEGLARTIKNNKFGFINKKLEVVIKPAYDFAFPFNNGISKVCNGCVEKKDGDHKSIEGGQWGHINKQGDVVIEIKYSKNELQLLKK